MSNQNPPPGLQIGDQEIVASKEPANNRYGQNGYQGPSSDLPGQHTTSGFLPQAKPVAPTDQTRPVSAEQGVPIAYGMKGPSAPVRATAKIDRTR